MALTEVFLFPRLLGFSGAVGRKKISTRGVLHIQSLYFVFVLLSFFCFVWFASFRKTQKKLVSFLVVVALF